MNERIEFEGRVKHNETPFKHGKLGIWLLNHRRISLLDSLLNKLPFTKPWQWIGFPADNCEVSRWNTGDKVRITVENLESNITTPPEGESQ